MLQHYTCTVRSPYINTDILTNTRQHSSTRCIRAGHVHMTLHHTYTYNESLYTDRHPQIITQAYDTQFVRKARKIYLHYYSTEFSNR
jgi:hypothetical protein